MKNKVLISDEKVERRVLGIILSNNKIYEEASDRLTPEMFYNPTTNYLYRCIGKMISEGEKVEVMTLWAYISQHPAPGFTVGIQELFDLDGVYDYLTFPSLCDYLANLHKRRGLYMLGMKLIQEGGAKTDTPVEDTMSDAMDTLKGLDDDTRVTIASARDALQSLTTIVTDNASGKRNNGVPVGFRYLDEHGGFQRGELIIIGGRSGNGKSSIALDMAIANAKAGYGIAYYTMEMNKELLMARGIAAETGLSSLVTMRHPLADYQWKMYDKGVGVLENLPIYFDEKVNSNIDRIVSSIRTLVHQRNIAGAYIDYMQILITNEKNMTSQEQFYGTVARRLKSLATELNIFVVLLSQFSREGKMVETHKPTVDMLRGSGQINEAADLTLLLYRPEIYGESYSDFPEACTIGTAEVIIGKGRNIGTGQFLVNFDGKRTHFSDIEGEIPKVEEKQEQVPFDPFDGQMDIPDF